VADDSLTLGPLNESVTLCHCFCSPEIDVLLPKLLLAATAGITASCATATYPNHFHHRFNMSDLSF
jgi:hypothetical protein